MEEAALSRCDVYALRVSTNANDPAAGRAKRSLSEGAQLYVLLVLAVSCALLLCMLPRELAALELPGLRLPSAAVQAVLQADALASQHAPRTPAALELERLYLEDGQAEDRVLEALDQRSVRRHQLQDAYAQLFYEQGLPAVLAMRARAVDKLEAALQLRLPQEQVTGVMGVFAYALQSYEATRGGEEVAPHFVLRSLYKVRWNLLMSLPADFAFTPVERLAHHGWIALHAGQRAAGERIQSLEQYAAAGGWHAIEAHGELLFLARQYALAARALQVAYEKTGNLRLRNYARGALAAAQ